MTKEKIAEQKQAVSAKFDSLKSGIATLNAKILEMTNEQYRLQGDYRTLESIEKSLEVPTDTADVAPVETSQAV